MTEPSGQQRNPAIRTDDLKPFINYRNSQDDKIRCALQEAAKRLAAEGKLLVLLQATKDSK